MKQTRKVDLLHKERGEVFQFVMVLIDKEKGDENDGNDHGGKIEEHDCKRLEECPGPSGTGINPAERQHQIQDSHSIEGKINPGIVAEMGHHHLQDDEHFHKSRKMKGKDEMLHERPLLAQVEKLNHQAQYRGHQKDKNREIGLNQAVKVFGQHLICLVIGDICGRIHEKSH